MPVTTIISDIAGVLLLKRPAWEAVRRQWEQHARLKEGAIMRALFTTELDEAAIFGRVSQEALVQQASAQVGIDLTVFVEEMWRHLHLHHELATFLHSLRPRYKVALLSNAWSGARSDFNCLFHLDRFVDLQIFSAEEGLAKPDERIYRLALTRLGVAPEETLFLDDRLENILAAQRLGIQVLHFDGNRSGISEIQRFLKPLS